MRRAVIYDNNYWLVPVLLRDSRKQLVLDLVKQIFTIEVTFLNPSTWKITVNVDSWENAIRVPSRDIGHISRWVANWSIYLASPSSTLLEERFIDKD
jgi:hypothetical protein